MQSCGNKAEKQKVSSKFCMAVQDSPRESWRGIRVSSADIFLSESLRILAERFISVRDWTPTETSLFLLTTLEVGVFSD